MESLDCVVIGAGVVGLAAARALAQAGREVVVLEKAAAVGTETSSRNSGVIHAGIYYPRGSLKARLCVQGRRALYAYCESHGVPHRRCGKLIVATCEAQIPQLQHLLEQALANGVGDMQLLDRDKAQQMEPALRCTAALHSPSTGIIDSHALMLAYRGEAEERGAMIAFQSPVLGGEVTSAGIALEVSGDQASRVLARSVINCAGLHAPALAGRLQGLPRAHVPSAWFAKGTYFTLAGRSPFSRLIYPPPEAAGLGVHLTLDLGGQARFGPDVEWIERIAEPIDYSVDERRGRGFYEAIRSYWPGLPEGALQPGYAGIRPKISAPGEPARDFLIEGPAAHGVPGLVNLFGIESPGLTASLAIAETVVSLLET